MRATGQDKLGDSPAVHHYFLKEKHQHDAKWGYDGEIGPELWAKLSPKYRLAAEGKRQSPINIPSKCTVPAQLPVLRFKYQEERIAAVNNGHTIQHSEKRGSFLHVGDRVYALEQFHFHVPSEHTIDGRHADMEIHFVHKSEKLGDVVVVAVMVYADSSKPAVDIPLYAEIPKQINEVAEAKDIYRNPDDLLPLDHRYFTYRGSFTTPPCTEGVHWIVMKSPVVIRPEVLAAFKRVIGSNNRPVQKHNDREILSMQSPKQD
jgi:carbonic anhydrase